MPSKAQIKAREAFVKKYAKKKKGSKTKIVYRLGGQIVSKKEYLNRERKKKAYDMRNKHQNWLRAQKAGISKKEFEKFWENFTKSY